MLLYLVDTMKRLDLDEQSFFRLAHIWAFGKDVSVADDVAQFRLHSVIPKYVQRYLHYVQGETT